MNRILLGLQSVVLVFLLKTGIIEGELKYYGNDVISRSTSGSDQRISPSGPRIWIDDPLNGESWPQWGYLQLFSVYIAPVPSTVPLPGVYLQLWSNTTMINNYTLKWQRRLENYQTGRSYQIAPEPGVVVEVSNYDRLGFTCDGNTCPVALDFEEDDSATASRAHRTYFRLLSRDGNVLPVAGDYRLTDNNALRGRFSIAVTLDNAPPRKSTEVYVGNELIRRAKVGTFGSSSLLDDSIVFPTGRLTAFYFRLDQLTASTSVQVNIWFPVPGSNDQYVSVYTRSVTLGPNKEKTYNLSITDGPLVNSSVRIGWTADKIFFSSGSGSCRQLSGNSGQVYTFDRLTYSYAASIGAIVDVQQVQQQPTTTTSSANPVTSPSLVLTTPSSKPVTSPIFVATTPSTNPAVTSSSYGISSSASSPAPSFSTPDRVTSWPFLITSSSDRTQSNLRSTGNGNGNGSGNGNGNGNGSTFSSRLRGLPIALFIFLKFLG